MRSEVLFCQFVQFVTVHAEQGAQICVQFDVGVHTDGKAGFVRAVSYTHLAVYKRQISASAVNTYLDCPLKFYFSVVEGIQEEEEVSETIESNVCGSILHKVMAVSYTHLDVYKRQ